MVFQSPSHVPGSLRTKKTASGQSKIDLDLFKTFRIKYLLQYIQGKKCFFYRRAINFGTFLGMKCNSSELLSLYLDRVIYFWFAQRCGLQYIKQILAAFETFLDIICAFPHQAALRLFSLLHPYVDKKGTIWHRQSINLSLVWFFWFHLQSKSISAPKGSSLSK